MARWIGGRGGGMYDERIEEWESNTSNKYGEGRWVETLVQNIQSEDWGFKSVR
jgi:hypothetical protein